MLPSSLSATHNHGWGAPRLWAGCCCPPGAPLQHAALVDRRRHLSQGVPSHRHSRATSATCSCLCCSAELLCLKRRHVSGCRAPPCVFVVVWGGAETRLSERRPLTTHRGRCVSSRTTHQRPSFGVFELRGVGSDEGLSPTHLIADRRRPSWRQCRGRQDTHRPRPLATLCRQADNASSVVCPPCRLSSTERFRRRRPRNASHGCLLTLSPSDAHFSTASPPN